MKPGPITSQSFPADYDDRTPLEELQYLELVEEVFVCPYCGDDYSQQMFDCCGERGRGELAYVPYGSSVAMTARDITNKDLVEAIVKWNNRNKNK